jgi:hypothetical protein
LPVTKAGTQLNLKFDVSIYLFDAFVRIAYVDFRF